MESKFTWQLKAQPDHGLSAKLQSELSLSWPTAQLLAQRGFLTSEAVSAFLHPDLNQLLDPLGLHDMQKAVDRIQQAIVAGEKIVIYGDYDVDGLTSTTIMKEAIEMLGGEVSYYIPNRFTDGYGPNLAAYQRLIEAGANLIVTVDNGVGGAEVVDFAQSQGVDVVVTDHHELPKQLPEAVAVVHPRYPGSTYAFKDLSGAGVAFKVACALLEEVPTDLLDLAALGTVADIVSMSGENRILVSYGLKVLQQSTRVGLQALYDVAKIDPGKITATTIGFMIGPRLNALGRMGDANEGVALLSTLDETKGKQLAEKTQQVNIKRQKLVNEIAETALTMAQTPENQAAETLVIAHANWHEGVLGIVASRIVEATGKPTLVLNIDEATHQAKGSGRSVESFHLFKSLDQQRDLMTHFGGHHMAVGLTLPQAQIEALHQGMEQYAAETGFHVDPKPAQIADLKLTPDDCTLEFYNELQQLAPFGPSNTQPLFELDQVPVLKARGMGQNNKHLRLELGSGQNSLTGVGFGFGATATDLEAGSKVDVLTQLNLNHFRGQTTLQLMIQDLRFSSQLQAEATKPSAQKPAKMIQTAHVLETDNVPMIQVHKEAKLSRHLFASANSYVFFYPGHLTRVQSLVPQAQCMAYDDERLAKQTQIMVVDQPKNAQQLDDFLKQQQAQQLTFAFYNPAPMQLIVPNHDQFAAVLIYVRKHQALKISDAGAMAQFLQMETVQLRFILKVFSQLGFVRIESGVLSIGSLATKKPLQSAPVYGQVQDRLKIEKWLSENSNERLHAWLNQRLLDINAEG